MSVLNFFAILYIVKDLDTKKTLVHGTLKDGLYRIAEQLGESIAASPTGRLKFKNVKPFTGVVSKSKS